MKFLLTVIGTRPEAIKFMPILLAIRRNKYFKNKVCITNQHTGLLEQMLLSLGIQVDYQFKRLENEHTLQQKAARILEQFGEFLLKIKPDLILVQGDTVTSFIAALAAFYTHIPIAHVEAGLRTGRLDSPWPEEGHRRLIAQITSYFFAPTQKAKKALLKEGVPSNKIWVVGNTSIDAIRLNQESAITIGDSMPQNIVVTIHRRENLGEPLKEICHALRIIATQFPNVKITFFLHPNPYVCKTVTKLLSNISNIDLLEPLDHFSFIRTLKKCSFIITDSGGIQEEASFIGKPVLITRDTTERPEGVIVGAARLVGIKSANIVTCCCELLKNPEKLADMSKIHYSYGDGYAAERIVDILEQEIKRQSLCTQRI